MAKEDLRDLFKYTVEFGLEDSQIFCKSNTLNNFSTLIKVEPCKYGLAKIHLGLSAYENDRLRLDHLIYIFSVERRREIEDVYNEAMSKIQKYIERLKFDFDNPSLRLRGGASVAHGSCKYEFLVGGAICGGALQSRMIHSSENFAKKIVEIKESLDQAKCQSSLVEEYIERFNSIEQIQDPLLKLVSLSSLAEYIEYTIKALNLIDWGEKTPKILDDEDAWAKKARHFVAHGVIKNNEKTLGTLQKMLGVYGQELFFDRKNPSHMGIVNGAVKIYTKSIKRFVGSL